MLRLSEGGRGLHPPALERRTAVRDTDVFDQCTAMPAAQCTDAELAGGRHERLGVRRRVGSDAFEDRRHGLSVSGIGRFVSKRADESGKLRADCCPPSHDELTRLEGNRTVGEQFRTEQTGGFHRCLDAELRVEGHIVDEVDHLGEHAASRNSLPGCGRWVRQRGALELVVNEAPPLDLFSGGLHFGRDRGCTHMPHL